MARLEARLRPALDAVVSRYERLEALGIAPAKRWAGTREHGLQGNTVTALAERGLVETAWEKGRRRLLCRPTETGLEEARKNRETGA